LARNYYQGAQPQNLLAADERRSKTNLAANEREETRIENWIEEKTIKHHGEISNRKDWFRIGCLYF